MALLQYRKVVDYEAQQAAFESFLQNHKTSPQETITHAIGNISIGEDDLDDDYDFMDEDDQQAVSRRKAAQRQPRFKYKDMMQQLADRKLDEVLIELDDLVTVSTCHRYRPVSLADSFPLV
jgi:DNA replication licensing factor MCM7